ncbi:MAG: hypothetical protein LBI82_02370 [Dysgonamonadaceae bacterium]|jgi:hypothetical protein|nr:hypothetical protein [Dysgonamonadaceae bacterium]
MKTLDLNAYGVEEMNQLEMKNVDGGLVETNTLDIPDGVDESRWRWYAAALIIIGVITFDPVVVLMGSILGGADAITGG